MNDNPRTARARGGHFYKYAKRMYFFFRGRDVCLGSHGAEGDASVGAAYIGGAQARYRVRDLEGERFARRDDTCDDIAGAQLGVYALLNLEILAFQIADAKFPVRKPVYYQFLPRGERVGVEGRCSCEMARFKRCLHTCGGAERREIGISHRVSQHVEGRLMRFAPALHVAPQTLDGGETERLPGLGRDFLCKFLEMRRGSGRDIELPFHFLQKQGKEDIALVVMLCIF